MKIKLANIIIITLFAYTPLSCIGNQIKNNKVIRQSSSQLKENNRAWDKKRIKSRKFLNFRKSSGILINGKSIIAVPVKRYTPKQKILRGFSTQF